MNTGCDSYMIIYATNKYFGLDVGQIRLKGCSRHIGKLEASSSSPLMELLSIFSEYSIKSYVLYIFHELNI